MDRFRKGIRMMKVGGIVTALTAFLGAISLGSIIVVVNNLPRILVFIDLLGVYLFGMLCSSSLVYAFVVAPLLATLHRSENR